MTPLYRGETGNGTIHASSVSDGRPAKSLCGREVWTKRRFFRTTGWTWPTSESVCRRCLIIATNREAD